MHLFKMYNSVGFGIFTKLCNHHHYLIQKRNPNKETLYPIADSPKPLPNPKP